MTFHQERCESVTFTGVINQNGLITNLMARKRAYPAENKADWVFLSIFFLSANKFCVPLLRAISPYLLCTFSLIEIAETIRQLHDSF